MSFRPAGFSSDEDDELNGFSFDGEIKSEKEKREEIAVEIYKKRREIANTAINRLYSALINRNVDQVKTELDGGLDVNCHVSDDWTPLLLAASQGSLEIVEELLNRGADVKTNRDGFTALMAACNCPKNSASSSKITSIVQKLLEHGIDAQAFDRRRRTSLMLACEQGFPEVVTTLLPVSNMEAEDNQSWTALFYAVNANEPDIVNLLLENGADLNHIDIRNSNAKYYAVLNDYQQVLSVLPEEEVQVNPDDLFSDDYDFEYMFENFDTVGRPGFSNDISVLLYGMKCENLIPLFKSNNVDLITFLNLDNEALKELGVKMSFQRNRILQRLHLFHLHRWKKKSVPAVVKGDMYSAYDIYTTAATTIKHLTVIEATIKYLKQNLDTSEITDERESIGLKSSAVLQKIRSSKQIAKLLHMKAIQYDGNVKGQADVITKDFQFKKNMLKKKIAIGFAGISVLFILRYCQRRFL